MKKYARLRQDCSEFDNALYNASPERPSFHDATSGREFFQSMQSRPKALSSDGSASPQRDSPPALRLAMPQQQKQQPPAPTFSTSNGPSHTDLTEALKKLASFREGGSHRHTEPWHDIATSNGERSDDASGSGRWQTAETASLSGRWGSVSTNDHWEDATQSGLNSFRDSLSLSRSGRLVQEGEPWTASTAATPGGVASSQSLQRNSSLRDSGPRIITVTTTELPANDHHLGAAVQRNISMRETQGWLASVKRPLQPRKSINSNAWEDPNEFNWRQAASTSSTTSARKERPMATVSQSMRYDRLKSSDLDRFDGEPGIYPRHGHHSQSGHHAVMQKAASMREGGAHSDAIMAMARAYSERHGVPQAILECVACGRGLGVIVQGNPGIDTSFCQSCRPHALAGWQYNTKGAPENGKSKRKGMMHFCKKILRMGKKPNKLKF